MRAGKSINSQHYGADMAEKQIHYSIHPDVFTKFPGFVRGIVLAYDVKNGDSPDELVRELREEEDALRKKLTLETLTEHPSLKAWREAFRSLGMKPSEFRPSIEALARRVLHGDPLPSINALVDISTLVSLRYLLPAGAHAIDVLTRDIALRPATGGEVFTALGSDVVEHPLPGEIIFTEGDVVLTRRWVWRQSHHTLTLPETTAIEFNIDALPQVNPAEVEKICLATEELVQKYCGGNTVIKYLKADQPVISLFH
jgi:DNA/RNA-binding domain of Phe-tRNA-synthetase-like protein